jgi:Dolichyl-phosphate-mannose-protein mannosyltransferase
MEALQPKGRDLLVALLLFCGTGAALGLAQQDQGVMRDEATYYSAAESYWGWFAELANNWDRDDLSASIHKSSISRYWANNNEHPVLFKTLMAVSWRTLHGFQDEHGAHLHPIRFDKPHESLDLTDEISAFRAPGWLFTALCVALIFIFGVRIESRTAGLAAALLYITIPRVFFHGQLACFDSAVTTMWLMVVYAYFRSLEKARWAVIAAVLFGLALATKHNAWFIPALLLIHYLMVIWPDLSLRPLRLPRIPLVFISMAILGPLVFLAHWPWLWFDTVKHLKSYFGFHLHHSYYNMEYLGQNWGTPPLPISYPFGMTLFTVPLVLLVLALAGIWLYARTPVLTTLSRVVGVRPPSYDSPFRYPARRSWKRPGKGLDPLVGRLLAINALFPLLLIALPSTPIFGGTKHWLPAYPFMALLAGVALSRLVKALAPRLPLKKLAPALLALLIAVPGALSTWLTHPYGLSQYSALAGGPAGGADLGLNRQFWGYATKQLLPWMNKTLPKNARVYWHDTNHGAYVAYIRAGDLRPDIVYARMELPGIQASDWALVIHELHFNKYDYWIWDSYGTAAPVKVLDLDGVPLISVYKRPSPGKNKQ